MTRQLFQWNPDLGAERSMKPRVQVNKFGDGYEQRTRLGINTMPESWSVVFTGNASETAPIIVFLEEHGAHQSFDWVTPLNQTKTFVCREWTMAQSMFGICTISGTFDQVFEAV